MNVSSSRLESKWKWEKCPHRDGSLHTSPWEIPVARDSRSFYPLLFSIFPHLLRKLKKNTSTRLATGENHLRRKEWPWDIWRTAERSPAWGVGGTWKLIQEKWQRIIKENDLLYKMKQPHKRQIKLYLDRVLKLSYPRDLRSCIPPMKIFGYQYLFHIAMFVVLLK